LETRNDFNLLESNPSSDIRRNRILQNPHRTIFFKKNIII
jgi:hypothetical protein